MHDTIISDSEYQPAYSSEHMAWEVKYLKYIDKLGYENILIKTM